MEDYPLPLPNANDTGSLRTRKISLEIITDISSSSTPRDNLLEERSCHNRIGGIFNLRQNSTRSAAESPCNILCHTVTNNQDSITCKLTRKMKNIASMHGRRRSTYCHARRFLLFGSSDKPL